MTGWSPTFFGYSVRLLCINFGYRINNWKALTGTRCIQVRRIWILQKILLVSIPPNLKNDILINWFCSSDLLGPEKAYKYKTWVYLGGSASAEFIADIALCPLEAVKVRMQTTIPPAFTGTFSGLSSIIAKEGVSGWVQEDAHVWMGADKIPAFTKDCILYGPDKFHVRNWQLWFQINAPSPTHKLACRYNDEICIIWNNRRIDLQELTWQEIRLWKYCTNSCFFRWRVYCWYSLCYCISSSRCMLPPVFHNFITASALIENMPHTRWWYQNSMPTVHPENPLVQPYQEYIRILGLKGYGMGFPLGLSWLAHWRVCSGWSTTLSKYSWGTLSPTYICDMDFADILAHSLPSTGGEEKPPQVANKSWARRFLALEII